jgi:uncharacterized protein
MKARISELPDLAKRAEAVNKKLFSRLKKNPPKDLDIIVKDIHEKVFLKIDCLECANCCKSISPIITDKDIERIAKFLKVRPSALTEKHLHLDEDNDYVFNTAPCPFLDEENYCRIYDVRPRACSEYPHTSQSKFISRLNLTIKNSYYCPAVFNIIEKIKERIK